MQLVFPNKILRYPFALPEIEERGFATLGGLGR